MDANRMMQIDIAVGAFLGALSGALEAAQPYHEVFSQRAVAAFAIELDLDNETRLVRLADSFGFDPELVLNRYYAYREQGATPQQALSHTHLEMLDAAE